MTNGYPAWSGVALVAAAFLLVLLRMLARTGLRVLLNMSARVRRSRPWLKARQTLVVAALAPAALFGCFTVAVVHAGWGARWDSELNLALAPYRVPWLVHAFNWLTTLGTDAALAGVAVTATGFLWAGRRTGLILPLWLSFTGAQATTWISKYAIGRIRPVFLEGLATAASPSYPSAHASGAAATFGFVAYAVTRDLDPCRRFEVAYWTACFIALVGFSRIFLGVHFATDVTGGFLVGGAWLLAGIALSERTSQRQATSHMAAGTR